MWYLSRLHPLSIYMPQLNVNEIFYSLQGESSTVGFPTVFIRLTGCPLRCGYCDSSFAFEQGEEMDVSTILKAVAGYQAQYVTVTGGEPLAQRQCLDLLVSLCDAGYKTSLETGGMLDVSQVDPRVMKVIDLKTPGSGECESNRYENIEYIQPKDQIKFVICDEEDYIWSKQQLDDWHLLEHCEVLFSPCQESQDEKELAEWILRDHLPVRFQIQLHKQLWGDERGK